MLMQRLSGRIDHVHLAATNDIIHRLTFAWKPVWNSTFYLGNVDLQACALSAQARSTEHWPASRSKTQDFIYNPVQQLP